MNLKDARASRSRARLLDAGKSLLIRNPQASLSEVAVEGQCGQGLRSIDTSRHVRS